MDKVRISTRGVQERDIGTGKEPVQFFRYLLKRIGGESHRGGTTKATTFWKGKDNCQMPVCVKCRNAIIIENSVQVDHTVFCFSIWQRRAPSVQSRETGRAGRSGHS